MSFVPSFADLGKAARDLFSKRFSKYRCFSQTRNRCFLVYLSESFNIGLHFIFVQRSILFLFCGLQVQSDANYVFKIMQSVFKSLPKIMQVRRT